MLNQIARIAVALVVSALALPAVAQIQERIVKTGSVVETHRLDPATGTYTWSVCNKTIFPNGTEQIEQAYCMTQSRKITEEEAVAWAEMHTQEMLSAANYGRYAANTEAASRQLRSDIGGNYSSTVSKSVSDVLQRGAGSSYSKMEAVDSGLKSVSTSAQRKK